MEKIKPRPDESLLHLYTNLLLSISSLKERVFPEISQIAVNCPDKAELINRIIDAAAQAGAGNTWESYKRVAMVLRGGIETFVPVDGAMPAIGQTGVREEVPSARILMQCPTKKVPKAVEAIRQVHPYENPVIEVSFLPGQRDRNMRTIRK
ncbi:hypothetical protein GYA28_03615 [Candidatus Roizmanbacteria bacterium]|nr:hypothetical protein [Candidatus Roizmanbacteria bacterium]